MQGSMSEKRSEWSAEGKNITEKTSSQVRAINPEDIRRTATEIGNRVREASSDAFDRTVGYIRRNPVRSAVGLCAAGFLAGLLTGAMRKSA